MAPRIEMYTQLACEVHKPDYTLGGGSDVNASFSGTEDPNGAFWCLVSRSNLTHEIREEETLCRRSRGQGCCSNSYSGLHLEHGCPWMSHHSMVVLGTRACPHCATARLRIGQLSDRVGRIRVLGIVVSGVLFADANFVSVSKLSKVLPGSYWWFVLGALVEGIFGSKTCCLDICQPF